MKTYADGVRAAIAALRAELATLFASKDTDPEEPTCARCGGGVAVDDDCDWEDGMFCHPCEGDMLNAAVELADKLERTLLAEATDKPASPELRERARVVADYLAKAPTLSPEEAVANAVAFIMHGSEDAAKRVEVCQEWCCTGGGPTGPVNPCSPACRALGRPANPRGKP